MKSGLLIFFSFVAFLVAGFVVFKNFGTGKREAGSLVIRGREHLTDQIPDYSGIKVSDLVVKELRIGSGVVVDGKSKVKVSFEGWIYDPGALGNKGHQIFFKDTHRPRQIDMAGTGSMQGMKNGLMGMRVGGLRQIVIPPPLVTGEKELEDQIPQKAIVLIEVELQSMN